MVSQSSRVFYCIVLLGLGVGCSKSNDAAAPVGVRAAAPTAAAPAAPAPVPESVKPESPAAPVPVKSPLPPPKPPGDPVIAALGQAMDTLNASNRLDCAVLSRHGVMSWDQCSSFQSVIDSGRTSRHRKAMLAAMKRHGYVKLKGMVVALVATNTYEVTARKKYSRYRRALLVTRSFRYTTTGRYRLWVRHIGDRWITTKRGASQAWPIYEENRVGRAYSRMRKARAGQQTSEGAKRLARALIQTQMMDRLKRK